MSKRIEQASIHFQLLIIGTVLLGMAFIWVVTPQKNESGNSVNVEWNIVFGLAAIAGYLAFVVLVAGHALLKNPRRSEPPDESD
jgi:uncharacterized membrane protein YozB (DUF420 family)